jgi:hypothetical protein
MYSQYLLNVAIRHLQSIMLDAQAASSAFSFFTSALIMMAGHGGRL